MESRIRISVTACVLALALLSCVSTESFAKAIELDNNVDIVWQQKAFANFFPTVVNGNFIVTNEVDLDLVFIAILVTRSDLLGGVDLTLDVVDPLSQPATGQYNEILVGSSALKLTFAAGKDNFGDPLPGATDPFAGNPYDKTLSLSDFHNSLQTFVPSEDDSPGTWIGPSTRDVLLGLLDSGPLGFSIDAHFHGSFSLPADIPCQQDPSVCKPFPGSASITESGGRPFPPTTTVPEPSSFAMLVIGGASVLGARRRRRRN